LFDDRLFIKLDTVSSLEEFKALFPIEIDDYDVIYMDDFPDYREIQSNISIIVEDDLRLLKKGGLFRREKYLFSF